MVKIVTPVSGLFCERYATAEIMALSDALEGRDHMHHVEIQWQALFHFDLNIVNRWRKKDRAWVERILGGRKHLEMVSFHISTCCSNPVPKEGIFQPGGEIFSRGQLLSNAKENLTWLKKITANRNVLIAVENNNYYPTPAYEHVTDPEFITRIVDDNKIGFLFDLAHARITVLNRALLYEPYLAALPMERALQIHVSQWGNDAAGMAVDAHEAPGPKLNEEILKIVKKNRIKYVTIEYYSNLYKLLETLKTYRMQLEKRPM